MYSKVEHSDKETNEKGEEVVTRAVTERIITRKGSERIIRYAFELAKKQNYNKVTLVHKANVLRETCGLFREVGLEVAKEYAGPDSASDSSENNQGIEMNEMLVDACAMALIRSPKQFQVIVTTNLFGDIISDEACMLVGGLGLACSGNIGENAAVFEAVHGSAPDIVGQEKANPIATILSAAFMLEHIGSNNEAEKIRNAVRKVLENKQTTQDLGGTLKTKEVTDAIIENL